MGAEEEARNSFPDTFCNFHSSLAWRAWSLFARMNEGGVLAMSGKKRLLVPSTQLPTLDSSSSSTSTFSSPFSSSEHNGRLIAHLRLLVLTIFSLFSSFFSQRKESSEIVSAQIDCCYAIFTTFITNIWYQMYPIRILLGLLYHFKLVIVPLSKLSIMSFYSCSMAKMASDSD